MKEKEVFRKHRTVLEGLYYAIKKIKRFVLLNWYMSFWSGLLTSLRFMNGIQRIHLIYGIIIGKAVREFRVNGGKEFPDKTFYIVRRADNSIGLFSFYVTALAHIKYAIDKGFIPIVDMCNYRNGYLDKKLEGKKNSWEYYFYQPCGYDVNQAYKAKNLILGDMLYESMDVPNAEIVFLNNDNGTLDTWREIAKKYAVVRNDIQIAADKLYETLIRHRKCLGVTVRGTDYVALKPAGHPIMPSTDTVICDAERMLSEYNCQCLYLTTDDSRIIKAFKTHFEEKCVVYERKLIDYTGGRIMDNLNKECPEQAKASGRDYLLSIMLLAKTDVLLAGRPSSLVGCEIMSSGWEAQHLYDLGYYE